MFFRFLGEHHIILKDITNLIVILDTLDENTTFKSYGLHSKVHPFNGKKASKITYLGRYPYCFSDF